MKDNYDELLSMFSYGVLRWKRKSLMEISSD